MQPWAHPGNAGGALRLLQALLALLGMLQRSLEVCHLLLQLRHLLGSRLLHGTHCHLMATAELQKAGALCTPVHQLSATQSVLLLPLLQQWLRSGTVRVGVCAASAVLPHV